MLFIGLSSFPTRLVIIIFDSIDFPIVIRKKKKEWKFSFEGKRNYLSSLHHLDSSRSLTRVNFQSETVETTKIISSGVFTTFTQRLERERERERMRVSLRGWESEYTELYKEEADGRGWRSTVSKASRTNRLIARNYLVEWVPSRRISWNFLSVPLYLATRSDTDISPLFNRPQWRMARNTVLTLSLSLCKSVLCLCFE